MTETSFISNKKISVNIEHQQRPVTKKDFGIENDVRKKENTEKSDITNKSQSSDNRACSYNILYLT